MYNRPFTPEFITEFIAFAKAHPEYTFLVTPIVNDIHDRFINSFDHDADRSSDNW